MVERAKEKARAATTTLITTMDTAAVKALKAANQAKAKEASDTAAVAAANRANRAKAKEASKEAKAEIEVTTIKRT